VDAIVVVDESQRIVVFNAAAERLFGCPAEHALGEHLERFVPPRFRAAHAARFERVHQTDAHATHLGTLPMLCGLRVDGEEFPCEASLAQHEAGGRREFTVIIRDVTERLRFEDALLTAQRLARESEERFRLIASSVPVIIWMTDVDGRCMYVNESWTRLTGLAQDAAMGDGWGQRVHPEDAPRSGDLRQGLERQEAFQTEHRLRGPDGEFRWVLVQGFRGTTATARLPVSSARPWTSRIGRRPRRPFPCSASG
jgi:PAS domain S-box-containing protein